MLERRTLLTALVPGFAEETYVSELVRPTVMEFAPDGRLFIAEQNGKLRVFKNGTLTNPGRVVIADSSVERGLIGLALDPDFATNKFIYIYWTARDPAPHNVVSRLTMNGDVADAGSRVDLLTLPDVVAANHNGGALKFGPDGKLYVAVGENGNPPLAQDLSNPFGKILRINKDGSIPTSNPFYNAQTGISRAIWAYGLRNTFTFAFQQDTGRFFGNDVGQDKWEEINELERGGNYGWPTYEGPEGAAGFELPFYAFRQHTGPTAIVGGSFYDHESSHSKPFPSSYNDTYFYAEAGLGDLFAIDLSEGDDNITPTKFAENLPYPVDIDVGPDGALYVLCRVTAYETVTDVPRVVRYTFTGSNKPSIGLNPRSQTVPVGTPVTFTADASGTALSYQWQRDGVNISGATGKSYTISATKLTDNGAKFRVVVSNSAGSATSTSATLTVVDNQPPVPVISAPATGTKFVAGQPIAFTGSASDPEDGAIDPATLTWNISYFRNGLDTPFLDDTQQASGTFTPATVTPYLLTDVFYRIRLTATDSEGLSKTTSVDVFPTTTTLTLTSNVPGLALALDGVPVTAPYTVDAVAGLDRPVSAAATQELNGVTYDFVGWSDNGALAHTISTPVAPTTFTANYQARTQNPPPPAPPPPPPPPDPPPGTDPPPETHGFDLTPAVVKFPHRPVVAGSHGSAQLRIANRGDLMFAGPVEVSLFLSTDERLDDSDVPATTLSKTLRLRTGAHPSLGVKFDYPQVEADGDYRLLARVVPLNVTGNDADPSNDVAATQDFVHVNRATVDLSGDGAAPALRPARGAAVGETSREQPRQHHRRGSPVLLRLRAA